MLENLADKVMKDCQNFERLVVSKEKLLEMFDVHMFLLHIHFPSDLTIKQYNKYKKYFIETKVPDGTSTTVYRCGPMMDLDTA